MNIFGLHSENNMVGSYRIWSPLSWLKKNSQADTKYLSTDPNEYFAVTPEDPKYDPKTGSYSEMGEWADIIVRQKIAHLPEYGMAMAIRKQYNVPLVVDCDDDITHVNPNNPAAKHYEDKKISDMFDATPIAEHQRQKYLDDGYIVHNFEEGVFAYREKNESVRFNTLYMMQDANAVTTSSLPLKYVLMKYNKQVYLLPNCIDFNRWKDLTLPVKDTSKVRIGWFGGQSHYDDLKIIQDVIPHILDKYPNTEFAWCGITPDYWLEWLERYKDSGRLFHFAWEQDVNKWEQHYTSFGIDIGLAPLQEGVFNRCKSNIKWMENAVLGIPTIASPVEPYMCIKHKQDGLLADNFKDWVTCIGNLVKNEAMRKAIGQCANERIINKFSMEKNAWRWLEVYEDVQRHYNLKQRGVLV